mmetsp:Transcript_11862/g.17348  ORF Transcript_11862/g.17348 Transcript_11862/m.17348 type:complete len:340 (+) Transcript_11862:11-1030(+)
MGNQTGKAQLYIAVEQMSAEAGSEISGLVHMNVSSTFKAKSLVFEFSGTERCRFGNSGIKCKGTKVCMSMESWNGNKLQEGQYSYPFRFAIPNTVPGSFKVSSSSLSAEVAYFAKCYLLNKNDKKEAKDKTRILVYQAIDLDRFSIKNIDRIPIQKCCCNYGTSVIEAKCDKNAYLPSELVKVIVEVNNSQCKASIDRLECCLYRTIRLAGKGQKVKVVREKLHSSSTRKRIPGGISLLSEQAVQVEINLESIFDQIQYAATTRAKLVECNYSIDVTAHFGDFASTQSLSTIIMPTQTTLPGRAVPSAPSGEWNPLVMECAYINERNSNIFEPSAPEED